MVQTAIFLSINITDSRIKAFANFIGSLMRAIINNDDLDVLIAGGKNAFQPELFNRQRINTVEPLP